MSRAPRDRHEYRNQVLSEHGPTSSTARLVALALTQCMDGKTMESRAGQPLLARLTALSERTVRDALAALKDEGWLRERPGAKPWQRIRRAVIPDSVPANSAGAVPANSAGSPPANGSKAPADPDLGTGKRAPEAPAGSAADPVLGPVPDPVQDPGAAPPSPAEAGSAAHRRWTRDEVIARETAVDREKQQEGEELKRATEVGRLLRAGKTPEEVVTALQGRVTLEFVLSRKRLREMNPMLRRGA